MARKQSNGANRTREAKAPSFIAWNVTDKGEKSVWTRVGAAWTHKDGDGLTLQLEMLHVNGRLVLRKPGIEADPATATEAGA
ncbi:MAG: hypothetical protein Q8P46_03385 [Hyphomicrobiales bacterium]|nr:hypothetical protein [Hyphomicrobiales bacterium]